MTDISVGLLGSARGLTLATLFDRVPWTRTVAVCDRIPARLDDGLKRCPDAKAFSDYEKMLASSVDVVIVASSPPQHAEHVCMALEAGKAVLSEVPAAHTLEDAQRILDTVEKTGGFYMMGENCNYYGYIHEWKRLMDEGTLGQPVHAEGEYIHDIRGMTWIGPDGELYTPEAAAGRDDVYPSWRRGYHPIRYITHSLGPLLWLIGTRCTSVSCLSTGPRTAPEIGSPDMEAALFETETGVPVRQTTGFSVPNAPGGQWFSLYTTKGCAEWSRANWDKPKLFIDGQEGHDMSPAEWTTELKDNPLADSDHGGIDGAMVWDFADALLNGKPSPIDVHMGMDYTLPGIYAAMSAERNGERLRIPDTRIERLV